MIFDELIAMVKNGAAEPLQFWRQNYRESAQKLIPELGALATNLADTTPAKQNLLGLIKILESEEPSEFALTNSFLGLVDIFYDGTPTPQKKAKIQTYIVYCREFHDRAQTAELYANERALLIKTLSPDKQIAYDHALFQNEGMVYCLELFLAMYHAITMAPDESQRRKIIESFEIDMGSGNVPGLWMDFKYDDMLTRFLVRILNETIREELVQAYYMFKRQLMKIHLNCDKQGNCSSDYNGVNTKSIVAEFKIFIQLLLKKTQTMGFERLTSYLLSPYGQQPLIDDVLIKL